MTSLADALTSSTSRPLTLRMRPDLVVQRQTWQHRDYWVIKDPIALKYYRFESEEFAILQMLDGTRSLDTLQSEFERQFAPQKITSNEIYRLLGMLHRSGLLLADSAGQGEQLCERAADRRRQQRWAAIGQLMSIRFRGVDPDRFLTWLNGWLGWFFSVPAAIVVGLIGLAALLLLGAEYDTFRQRLPQFDSFFAAENWLWLGISLCFTKVLHEIGHGLACKRFGGQCHEMGVLLLCFTPCLYCNVTDSWIIPSRWRRAAIGAAGMYVELLLASLATFVWWFSHPGLINGLALNVMFVCSVSTLLFNANPLMRYDGYYILSDLVEIPNLRQKASSVLRNAFSRIVLGLPEQRDPFLPTRHRALFATYSVASSAYSWLISVSIFWFFYGVLKSWGLTAVTPLIAAMMLYGLVFAPLWRLALLLRSPQGSRRVKKMRALVCLGAAAACLAALLTVPLPYYVACPLIVQPRDATAVYVDSPGRVAEVYVRYGEVAAGQPLVRLENDELIIAHQQLQSQRDRIATRLESIRQRATTDNNALLEQASTQESLAALDKQLARHQLEIERLTVKAPVAGLLLPPSTRPANKRDSLRLASWAGRPLDNQNIGAYLESSVIVCRIADVSRWEALLAVPQGELEFLAREQQVDLILNHLPGERFSGAIGQISQQQLETTPASLSSKSGGSIATRTNEQGAEQPLEVTYQVSVPIDDPAILIAGGVGAAKIHAGYQTLYQRLWRACCRTFHFEM